MGAQGTDLEEYGKKIDAKKVPTIVPLADRVVVKPLDADTITPGGILIPGTAQEKPRRGEIISAGIGRVNENATDLIPMEVKKGDMVLYGKYTGTEFTLDGQQYLIMKESDILAVLIPGDPEVETCSMKRLTQQQVDDRMVVYDEVLDDNVYDTKGEKEQGNIVQEQIRKLRDKFYKKH